jgi:hypothetical protein
LLKKHDLRVEEFKRMKTGMPNWFIADKLLSCQTLSFLVIDF